MPADPAAPPPPQLTILTATHNRAHLLPRLYESLRSEWAADTAADWLIIDDSSTDETPQLIAKMAAEGIVPITSLRVPHGGKHRALNAAFTQARGDWFLIIDSDDWFMPGGLARAQAEIRRAEVLGAEAALLPLIVPRASRQYRFLRPGRVLSFVDRANEEPPFDATLIFRKTARGLRFPEFDGENFLAEAALWYRMGSSCRMYIANTVAVYAEYQPDGLSVQMRRNRMNSPVGATYVYQTMLSTPLCPRLRLRTLANFGRFWWHSVLRGKRPLPPRSPAQALTLPFAWVFALYDIQLLRRGRQGNFTLRGHEKRRSDRTAPHRG